jgi:hypothetical protein
MEERAAFGLTGMWLACSSPGECGFAQASIRKCTWALSRDDRELCLPRETLEQLEASGKRVATQRTESTPAHARIVAVMLQPLGGERSTSHR